MGQRWCLCCWLPSHRLVEPLLVCCMAAGIVMFKNLPRQVTALSSGQPTNALAVLRSLLHVAFISFFFNCKSCSTSAPAFLACSLQTFGRVQSKLFPIYFGLSSACSAIQLGVLLFGAAAAPQKQLVLLGKLGRWDGAYQCQRLKAKYTSSPAAPVPAPADLARSLLFACSRAQAWASPPPCCRSWWLSRCARASCLSELAACACASESVWPPSELTSFCSSVVIS